MTAYDVPRAARRRPAVPRARATSSPGTTATRPTLLRVVRDDARGLVAWLPSGSEQLVATSRATAGGLRDRRWRSERLAVAERVRPAASRPGAGRGSCGSHRPACRGRSGTSRDDAGTFDGHYVNLELVHERPADGSPRVHTRDLIARPLGRGRRRPGSRTPTSSRPASTAGWYTAAQAEVIRAIAEQARARADRPARVAARRRLGGLAAADRLGRAADACRPTRCRRRRSPFDVGAPATEEEP